MAGINQVLLRLANLGATRTKQAFVPMVGGQPDPSAGAGAPPGGDPAAAGAGAPPPGQDPMSMVAQGADPAAIMAAQGQPVDPMLAMAGGATGMPPPGAGAPPPTPGGAGAPPIDPAIQAAIDQSVQTAMGGAPGGAGAGAGKGGKNELNMKVTEMHTMLTKILGVLVGKGLLPAEELGAIAGRDQGPAGIPPEQKAAAEIEPIGQPVRDNTEPVIDQEKVASQLADLILSLRGKK